MASEPPQRIPIYVSNHQALVWDVQDIATLRSQHRICGTLSGTLPHLAQQNVFLGVPLTLMPEEVVLLMEKQLAILVDDVTAHHTPLTDELTLWEEKREKEKLEGIAQQSSNKEGTVIHRGMSDDAIRKRQERARKKTLTVKPGDAAVSATVPTTPQVVLFPDDSSPSTPTDASSPVYTVKVPTTSHNFSWYQASTHSFDTLEIAKDAGIWLYPATLHERARCGVFRKLWEKGYYIGCGVKFGGEYLVYPGDPLRYHSHFVASIYDSPQAPLLPMEIVGHGRLGTATKKAHVLCSWNDNSKVVELYSIEWAGFG